MLSINLNTNVMLLIPRSKKSLDFFSNFTFNPFRTTRFQLVQKLSFFQILLPLGCKTTCRCPHVNTTSSFQEIFGDTHVPIVLKGKLHTFLNIFIDNEISTLSSMLALSKFIITIEMLFRLFRGLW